MDGTRFDQLIKQLGTTRVSRLTALRGLAVGAVAAAVGFAAPDEADAKGRKCGQCKKRKCHKSNDGKKRCRCKKKANGTFCSIAGVPSAVCSGGSCVAAVTPTTCSSNSQCAPRICINGQCANCTSSTQCDAPNTVCNTATGTCVAPGGAAICTPNQPCTGQSSNLVCNSTGSACVACTATSQCGGRACLGGQCLGLEACDDDNDCKALSPLLECDNQDDVCVLKEECPPFGNTKCTGGEFCLLGECVRECGPTLPGCPGSGANAEQCISGVCLENK